MGSAVTIEPLDTACPSREPEGRMRFAIGCIALMTMAASGAAQGATRALEGWGALRFGMSTAEVLQAAGPKAASEDTLLSGPVVVWSGVDEGTPVQVVAFVPDGRLHAVKLYLPDLHHTNEEQCYARLDAAVEALSRRHGPPDEMTVGDAAGEHVSGWRAIFRFADGATIVAEAELQETHLTCTTDVTYDANR